MRQEIERTLQQQKNNVPYFWSAGFFLIREGFKFVENTGMPSFQMCTHYKRTSYIILTSELTFSTLLTDTYTRLRGAALGPGCRLASSKKRCYCNGRWSLNTVILGGFSEFGLGRGFSLPPNYMYITFLAAYA